MYVIFWCVCVRVSTHQIALADDYSPMLWDWWLLIIHTISLLIKHLSQRSEREGERELEFMMAFMRYLSSVCACVCICFLCVCLCVCVRLNCCSMPPGWLSFFLPAAFQFCFSSSVFLFFSDETTHRMNACQRSVTLFLSFSLSPLFIFLTLTQYPEFAGLSLWSVVDNGHSCCSGKLWTRRAFPGDQKDHARARGRAKLWNDMIHSKLW